MGKCLEECLLEPDGPLSVGSYHILGLRPQGTDAIPVEIRPIDRRDDQLNRKGFAITKVGGNPRPTESKRRSFGLEFDEKSQASKQVRWRRNRHGQVGRGSLLVPCSLAIASSIRNAANAG